MIADAGIGIKFKRHGIYDEYALIGPPLRVWEQDRLGGKGIAEMAREFLKA